MYCIKESSTKYLGVTIQWKKHVNNITESATKVKFYYENFKSKRKTLHTTRKNKARIFE